MSTVPTRIASLQNQRIKDAIRLNKRNERDRRRLTLIEGERETSRALAAGIRPTEAFLCSEILQDAFEPTLAQFLGIGISPNIIFDTTSAVFDKLAYRGDSGGIVLVAPYFSQQLDNLRLPPTPLLLVIEGVEKPGNLGAILRTADAAGVDALLLTDAATDVHNPNTIRAALGACFTVAVAEATNEQTAAFLRRYNISILATTPHTDTLYWDADMQGPLAILLGSEAHGLSRFWLDRTHAAVRLPMYGAVDSLNLSTSTAIILYEALRQRAKHSEPLPSSPSC